MLAILQVVEYGWAPAWCNETEIIQVVEAPMGFLSSENDPYSEGLVLLEDLLLRHLTSMSLSERLYMTYRPWDTTDRGPSSTLAFRYWHETRITTLRTRKNLIFKKLRTVNKFHQHKEDK